MGKIDYTALANNSATRSEIGTYFNNYNDQTIPDTGALNFSDVAAGKTGTEPYEIINSILIFDKNDDSDTTNKTDPYYTGDYKNADWSTTLRYVTDSDLHKYATEYQVDYQQVKDFVTEVRKADLDGRMREGETGGNLAPQETVLDAFKNNKNSMIKRYVNAFDKNDGVSVGTITAADLNKFAQYYGLNDSQITKLVNLYPTVAKVKRRGDQSGDDTIPDKIVTK